MLAAHILIPKDLIDQYIVGPSSKPIDAVGIITSSLNTTLVTINHPSIYAIGAA